jgi:Ca2+-binding EF-hand superfamily protein
MSYVQEVDQKAELQSAENITTLAADDAVHLVAQAIVTDPEAFLKLGAAQNLEELTCPEFMQACKSMVPGFSQGAAQIMFTQFDTNKDGKVSLEELTETIELARHFHKQSQCESVILAALMPLIAGAQPLQALAELSEGSLRDAVVDKVVKALVKQANEVRETLARKKDFEARENDDGLCKFGTATYGGVADYFKGLEAVGTPHPHMMQHMKKEATQSEDSKDPFKAWNSGLNETFPRKEWDFVVEPFKRESIRKDKHPSEWELQHAYGGKRFPIRRQVFLHVLSAMASGIRFGDYKNADKREFEDPQWLHEAEVSLVKVVLLRLIKSQLGGVALFIAFNKHAGLRLTGESRYKSAKIQARRIVEALSKALEAKDSESFSCSESTCTYEFLVDKLKVLFTPLLCKYFLHVNFFPIENTWIMPHLNPCQSLVITISLGHRD